MVTYKVICKTCKAKGTSAVYFGETAQSAYVRAAWHLDSIRREAEDNGLHKHKVLHHPEGTPDYEYIVLETHKSALH